MLLSASLPVAAGNREHRNDSVYHRMDSIAQSDLKGYRYYIDLKRRPLAQRAVWLGAVVPGLGQIYNGSYWKLPIVYGGLMGCGYAISLNQTRYSDYRTAYRDLYFDIQGGCVTEDASKSYVSVLPKGYTIERMGGASTYCNTLENWHSTYRRYRDYSIVATVLVYALSLIDAYVDAQLFDFDISSDLSMQVSPEIHFTPDHQRSTELKLAFTF